MNNWKKIWKEEIDITVNRLDGSSEQVKAKSRSIKRRWYSAIACACALVLAVAVCFNVLKPAPKSSSVVLLEINPSIAFVVDANGKVSEYSSTNSDADIILSQTGVEEQLKGKSLDKALENFVDKAYEMGFVDYASDVIRISSDVNIEAIRSKLEQKFIENNINIYVAGDKLSKKDFAERLGLDVNGDNVGDLVERVKKLPEKFMNSADKILKNIDDIIEEVEEMFANVEDVMHPAFVSQVNMLKTYFEQFAYMTPFDIAQYILNNTALLPELLDNVQEVLNKLQEYRVESHKDRYHGARPEVNEEDYREFINNIKDGGGSLSDYFEQHRGGRRA